MKCSVVLTLLATFFSTGQATSNNDASEFLTSEAETARGISILNFCHYSCILDGGSNVEVENCIKTRCGGVNVEDGFEENAEVLNSEAETTQEPPSRDHICEFVCRHYLITEEDIQECIRVDCGRFNATNDGKKNSSEVLISEAETAPGSGNSCHFQCVLNGRSYDEVQVCIKARCRGVKTENDGKKTASEILISEAETAPGSGNSCHFHCVLNGVVNGRSYDEVQECIKARCRGNKTENDGKKNFDATEVLISEPENEPAGNSKTVNNDVSEVLITETFIPIDRCIFNCIANGQTNREIENCINWQCYAGKSDKSGEAKAIASEVRISENASTAQASLGCIWDCLRALKVHAVSEDDFDQCSLECGSRETVDESEKEFNLRGSIKSD
eukprot:scaffold12576_cov35-Cyclotella_meneghiniana.AAC.3